MAKKYSNAQKRLGELGVNNDISIDKIRQLEKKINWLSRYNYFLKKQVEQINEKMKEIETNSDVQIKSLITLVGQLEKRINGSNNSNISIDVTDYANGHQGLGDDPPF